MTPAFTMTFAMTAAVKAAVAGLIIYCKYALYAGNGRIHMAAVIDQSHFVPRQCRRMLLLMSLCNNLFIF